MPVNINVAGPWVIVLGRPVVLLTRLSLFEAVVSVTILVVVLSVVVVVGNGRWSTRVEVTTIVVNPASMLSTEPEARCKRVYGKPS